jgi:hypothetical protein
VLKISGPDFDDYVCAGTIAPYQLTGDTDGRVAIWRFREGRNIEALQMGGSYVRAAVVPPGS